MNERIRQLAEQAGGEFYTGFFGSPNSIKFMESDLENFAQLIVKECADICYNRDYTDGSAYGEAIEEHFGGE
jgi:hypothetical protein